MDNATITAIMVALLAVSEALSYIPALKSNGVFQLIVQVCRFLVKER